MEKFTKEMIAVAMQCNNANELVELVKSKGYDITQEEAEAYLEQFSSYELTDEELDGISGGREWDKIEERNDDCRFYTV